MKADDVMGAGALVQTIDVLCNQRELIATLIPGGQYFVSSIGFSPCDILAPPIVPFPDQ